jgi:hypothetical protein
MSRSSGSNSHAALNSPNLYWGAVSPAQLRRSSSYQALPDASSVVVTDTSHYRQASGAVPPRPACRRAAPLPPSHAAAGRPRTRRPCRPPQPAPACRFLRQTPELRDRTHRGILTTANLKDALGFCEPEAAKGLGSSQVRRRAGLSRRRDGTACPGDRSGDQPRPQRFPPPVLLLLQASHRPLLEAYEHLLRPHQPLQQGQAPDAAAATALNQAHVQRYNESLLGSQQPEEQLEEQDGFQLTEQGALPGLTLHGDFPSPAHTHTHTIAC